MATGASIEIDPAHGDKISSVPEQGWASLARDGRTESVNSGKH